jgi:hypothetical protein
MPFTLVTKVDVSDPNSPSWDGIGIGNANNFAGGGTYYGGYFGGPGPMTAAATPRTGCDRVRIARAGIAEAPQGGLLAVGPALRAGRARNHTQAPNVPGNGEPNGRLRAPAMLSVPFALDALNFLSADVRNLFGPFINVFLVTGQHWSQTDVGLVTTASGLAGIALQTPIGAAIDVTRAKRAVIVATMARLSGTKSA